MLYGTLNARTLVLKTYNDKTKRTIPGNSGVDLNVEQSPPVFPDYPGLTYVGCIGGHANGSYGLIVYNNRWVYNCLDHPCETDSISWALVYRGKENEN